MWNPFKKKNKIDDAGNHDWTFQFVRGGFALNNALRRDKRYRAIVWLGGFNFKLIWVRKGSEATFFESFPQEPVEYSVRMKFDADLLRDSFGDVLVRDSVTIPKDKFHIQDHKPICEHDWQIAVNRETNRFSDMVCSKCGEIHKTKEL